MDYPVGFYFELSFQGEDSAFQEVSGIAKEMNVEEVVSGGENRFKYRLPNVVTSQNLVLKRALIPADSKLAAWFSSVLDMGFSKSFVPNNVSVSLLAANGQVCKKWLFYKAYPVKYSVSDLKSQENALVVETMELAYQYFQVSSSASYAGLFV